MERVEAAIIGAGPAGISAGIWCVELGLRCVLLERETEPGGQMLWTHGPVQNYPGIRTRNGSELCDRFIEHAGSQGVNIITAASVVAADLVQRSLTLADGSTIVADNIVIATGVRRRTLGVPGEEEFVGRGVLRSGVLAKDTVKGKRVIIVGGGDAALENALILSETAERVTVVHRSDHLRAREDFAAEAGRRANISFLPASHLTEIHGSQTVEAVTIENTRSSATSRLETDSVLIRIGVEPNSELFADQLDTDEHGYIQIDSTCQTSLPRVYAIGDIANPTSPTIATAAGTGATAAKAIACP